MAKQQCAPGGCNFLPATSHTEVYWDFDGKAEGVIVQHKREAVVCPYCGEERQPLQWVLSPYKQIRSCLNLPVGEYDVYHAYPDHPSKVAMSLFYTQNGGGYTIIEDIVPPPVNIRVKLSFIYCLY